MQVIYYDKDEGSTIGRTGLIGAVLCARRSSKHVEGKCVGRTRGRGTEI